MSDYKKYFLRQLGLKENTFPAREEDEDPIKDMEDQSNDLENIVSTNNLGGYTPIPTDRPNSTIVDKTPISGVIDNESPKVPDGCVPTIPSEPHPHQTQKNSQEPPQNVTGAQINKDVELVVDPEGDSGIDINIDDTNPTSTDRLKQISNTLSQKSKGQPLSDKESLLVDKINTVLKLRGSK